MEYPNQPELLRHIFVMLGSSSAALIGLLFIAGAQHVKEIINDPVFCRRAFNNTCYLLIIFVESLLIQVPQPIRILGAELVVINFVGLWFPLRFIYFFFESEEGFRRGGGSIHRAIVLSVSFLLGITGGATLIAHLYWGIYLVAASCVILLVTVVLAAWSIMVGVGQLKKTPKAKRSPARQFR